MKSSYRSQFAYKFKNECLIEELVKIAIARMNYTHFESLPAKNNLLVTFGHVRLLYRSLYKLQSTSIDLVIGHSFNHPISDNCDWPLRCENQVFLDIYSWQQIMSLKCNTQPKKLSLSSGVIYVLHSDHFCSL